MAYLPNLGLLISRGFLSANKCELWELESSPAFGRRHIESIFFLVSILPHYDSCIIIQKRFYI